MRKSSKKPDAPNLHAIPATPARAEFQLTPKEMRLIRAYRQISRDCQAIYSDAIEGCASESRANGRDQGSGLRLVAGGNAQ